MATEKRHPSLPRPTERELEIVRILWDRGPSTVREVVSDLNLNRTPPLAYTTVLRFFQIMLEKGLVTRSDGQKGHIYQTSVPAERTKRQLAQDLIHRVFAGSAQDLVLHALGGRQVSSEELSEIKKLIRKIEKEDKDHE